MTTVLEGGEWSAGRPGRTLPPGKTRHSFYRGLGGPQGRSGRAENLVPTGIRSRTVQPVVSHYTGWATWPNDFSIETKIPDSILVMVPTKLNFGVKFGVSVLRSYVISFHNKNYYRNKTESINARNKKQSFFFLRFFMLSLASVLTGIYKRLPS